MRRLAFAIALVTALAAAVLLALNWPRAEASPDVTIAVNNTGDTVTKDDGVLTLREAMMLATGERTLGELSYGECNQVSGTLWASLTGCLSPDPPGASSSDTIVFDASLFSAGIGAFIPLGDTLPALGTGDDTVDGSGAEVIVEGGGTDMFSCFVITSGSNTIKGLEIKHCTFGVDIREGAQDNTVGGSGPGEGNVISGNRHGVEIRGDSTDHNSVKGNFIGTNAAGDTAVGNDFGVMISGDAQNNTIGGSTEAERNVISGNLWDGVRIAGDGTDHNSIEGNYIGTNAAGDAALPNTSGVWIWYGSRNNTIGGSSPGEGNVISGNYGSGVVILGSGTNGNVINGNFIGTDTSGTAAMGNGHYGVVIEDGSQNNTIGGTGSGEGNAIAFNQWHGVGVYDNDTTGNTIRGNSIRSNGDMGIRTSEGGNDDPARPTITGFGSVIGTACANCIIDIYSDEEDEGEVYEGSTTADGDGSWIFPGSLQGPNVTATATDSFGNTSEFSNPVAVPEATRTLVWSPGWHNATWTGTSTPEEGFACAAGNYAAAYRLVSGGWERHFPDRPELSNMTDLGQYDAFLILITEEVTCDMPVADPLGTERTLDWGVGWQNDGWTGADGMTPQDVFDCAEDSYAAAYRLVGGGWERHFPGRPDVSNMGPLSKYDPFLILVTAPVSCSMPIAP